MVIEPKTATKRDAVCLIGGKEPCKVVITSYNSAWPQAFQQHAATIHKALGNTALHIEHIGSTSVPGLAAKAIIDILVVVLNPADEQFYIPALLAAGYELRVREPRFDEHRMLRTPERDVHIHVFPPTSKEIGRYLAFRDRLRDSAADRGWYEETKRELAAHDWEDMNEYAEAKSKVVEAIIGRALRHAAGEDNG